ncbi:MAG: Bax inhibitor-1/YccA family protein [Ruthenibacterium sp.]
MENSKMKNLKLKAGFWTQPLTYQFGKIKTAAPCRAADYLGIAGRIVYFIMASGIGVLLYYFTLPLFPAENDFHVAGIPLSLAKISAVALCGVITVLMPFIALLLRPLLVVTGTLYMTSAGYLLAFLSDTFAAQYAWPIWEALALTVIITGSMAALYASGIVRYNKKIGTIVTTLFIVSVFGNTMLFLTSLLPSMQPVLQQLTGNAALSTLGSIFVTASAALFLWVDFDAVRNTAEQKPSKKDVWRVAFTLVFTVFWLYFKLLKLF